MDRSLGSIKLGSCSLSCGQILIKPQTKILDILLKNQSTMLSHKWWNSLSSFNFHPFWSLAMSLHNFLFLTADFCWEFTCIQAIWSQLYELLLAQHLCLNKLIWVFQQFLTAFLTAISHFASLNIPFLLCLGSFPSSDPCVHFFYFCQRKLL